MSLADRLALLNKQSTSSSSSNNSGTAPIVPGSLKSRIAKYDVAGAAPLIPKGSFGQGLGKPSEGRGAVSREMIGNRIPSAGRGGFGVTPGSRSTSASQAAPGLSGSSWSGPTPRSRTTSTTNSPTSASRSESPMSTGLPPPLSQPETTTNALPSSYLAATDPDALPPTTAASRSNSVLAQPRSTTSLSSMASIGSAAPSIASSYLPMSASQQPTPPTAEAADVPSVVEPNAGDDADDDALVVGGSQSGRPSSPVGSMMVEVSDSIAPSLADSEEDGGPCSPADAPGTPRAEPSVNALDDSTATLDKLTLADGEQEPAIEEAEHVPALEVKEEAEQTSEERNGAEVGIETPPASAASAEGRPNGGVDSWLESVAAMNGEQTDSAHAPERVEDDEAASAAPSLVVPPTDEEESVYHTPTLECESPRIPASDLPSDEEDADKTIAPQDSLNVVDVTAADGLATPKSASVTDFGPQAQITTPAAENVQVTSAADQEDDTKVEIATQQEIASLSDEPSPTVEEPTAAATESASGGEASADGASKEERERRKREKQKARKKMQRERKKASSAAKAEDSVDETPTPAGKDLPDVPATEKLDSEAADQSEHSEPETPFSTKTPPPPPLNTLPPKLASPPPSAQHETPGHTPIDLAFVSTFPAVPQPSDTAAAVVASSSPRASTPPPNQIPFPTYHTPPVKSFNPSAAVAEAGAASPPPTVEQTPPTPTDRSTPLPPASLPADLSSPTLSPETRAPHLARSASQMSRSSSGGSGVLRSKSPLEMDSDDDDVVAGGGNVKVRVISRERYS